MLCLYLTYNSLYQLFLKLFSRIYYIYVSQEDVHLFNFFYFSWRFYFISMSRHIVHAIFFVRKSQLSMDDGFSNSPRCTYTGNIFSSHFQLFCKKNQRVAIFVNFYNCQKKYFFKLTPLFLQILTFRVNIFDIFQIINTFRKQNDTLFHDFFT